MVPCFSNIIDLLFLIRCWPASCTICYGASEKLNGLFLLNCVIDRSLVLSNITCFANKGFPVIAKGLSAPN